MIFRVLYPKACDFHRDARGNVAMMFAALLVPVLLVAGMGIDYAMASRARAKLDAAADAAALAAVTPSIMQLTSQSAQQTAMQTAATNTFDALALQITGLQGTPTPVITICPAAGTQSCSSTTAQTVTVSYTAQVLSPIRSIFGGLIGQAQTVQIGGQSQASPPTPYVNFYLLLDDSPSMAIAATTAGINTMVSNTKTQGGCAFGCHESDPSADNLGNPHGEDNYALAQSLGVTLRIDLLRSAVQNLMTTAQTNEGSNSFYQMAIYTFDTNFNTLQALTSNLTSAQNSAANIQLLEVYNNVNGGYLTRTNFNDDTDTNFSSAMNSMSAIMGTPGNGTSQTNAQEYLFIVTDGVEDAMVNGQRLQAVMDTSMCTTLKQKGIKIAVLYTEYLPLPTDAWYNQYIAPIQSTIGPNLQSCASPGLYTSVTTDGDISAALSSLFTTAVQEAYLSK